MVTSEDGIIAVVIGTDGLAGTRTSPIRPANCEPSEGGLALTRNLFVYGVVSSPDAINECNKVVSLSQPV